MLRKYELIVVFAVLIALILSLNAYSMPENISKVTIKISYDPLIDSGVVVEKILFSEYIGDKQVIVDIPLINASTIEVVNVTTGSGDPLPYEYNVKDNTISIWVNNTDNIIIYYMIHGFMAEVAPEAYSVILDLSVYSGYTVEASIEIPGIYSVDVQPETGVDVRYTMNTTFIDLSSPEMYIISIYTSPVSPWTTSPPYTATTTTAATTTTTTGKSTGTSTKTSTTTTSPGGVGGIVLPMIIVVIIVAVVAAVLLMKRR